MTWLEMTHDQKIEAVKTMARSGMVEKEIQTQLGSPGGSLRTLANRHGIVITKARERRRKEAEPHTTPASTVWGMDDDAKRRIFAAKAAKGARAARLGKIP